MAFKSIYKIKITKWNDHNPNMKKTYRYTKISNSFCSDAKIRTLPMTSRWLFLNLVLTCGEQCRDVVELSSNTLRDMLECNRNIDGVLDSLKSLQLLTYEKIDPLMNRIEENRIELNRIKGTSKQKKPKTTSPPMESAAPVIGVYCDLWRERYKTESHPVILKKEAGMIKNFMRSVGQKKAIEIITAYLQMPDHWFVTKRHDIQTMIANLNSITQFMETGKMFTRNEIKNLDVNVTNQQTIDALRKGEI